MNEQNKMAVYQFIQNIPTGQVCSYGEVASLAGLPKRARWVGTLMSQLPTDSSLPWHRAIRASGELAFPPNSERFRTQKQKLIVEGIEFSGSRVPKRYFYRQA